MKNNLCLTLAALLLITIMGGTGLAEEKIVIAGTGDSQELLRLLAGAFEQANPGTKVIIPDSIGTSGGIRAVEKGAADMGRTARPMNEKEKKFGLNYKVFAHSPVVFAVNANVRRANNITRQQIVGVYSGRIKSWNELGCGEGKIYVANREEGDSSRSVIERLIPGFRDIASPAGEIINSTPETVEAIAKNRNTIGYMPLSMVKGKRLKVLKIEGVYPSEENIKNGSYRLLTPFALVWKGGLDGLSKRFVEFIFSREGRQIIAEHGAFPANPDKN